MDQHAWSQDDDLVAFYLYKFGTERLPFDMPTIAERRGIKPESMDMRIRNFEAYAGTGGLVNIAQKSVRVFAQYRDTPEPELRNLAFPELAQMNLPDIAEYVWANSHVIAFGEASEWDAALFTEPWWQESGAREIDWAAYGPGWYWFLSDMRYEELAELDRPTSLPQKGCNMGALVREHLSIFGQELLCKPDSSGMLVLYNGHEQQVSSRVRAHFTLGNDRTGALGLRHYGISARRWALRVFSNPCLTQQGDAVSQKIRTLMQSKAGRCSIESAWRAVHGWPVLCKE
ncbi:hypothetical protein JQX13_21085 [Archangium violaceum]|uniref:hypothetical protein n=1 Tax=Archangium violaceum TaxID=83451 RepID=UPI00193BE719|nr:hypothetical protein [Archangium violaceum]QRK12297.1 hypothetical protein JQX13_21085 [Archangium violaceum]